MFVLPLTPLPALPLADSRCAHCAGASPPALRSGLLRSRVVRRLWWKHHRLSPGTQCLGMPPVSCSRQRVTGAPGVVQADRVDSCTCVPGHRLNRVPSWLGSAIGLILPVLPHSDAFVVVVPVVYTFNAYRCRGSRHQRGETRRAKEQFIAPASRPSADLAYFW